MTELIWEGKYKDGQKVAPLRVKLPFQTVETVNESAKERQHTLDLFSNNMPTEWRNRLIWGDKKYVLPALVDELAGQIKLIYIDPPFFTGTDQVLTIHLENTNEYIFKEPSLVEEAAYRNVWKQGSDSFCNWIYETLYFLRELLCDEGAIYIRFDQYWSHYVKVIADEVFGKNNFQNEIVVKRIHKNVTQQGKVSIPLATDSLFVYFKSERAKYRNTNKILDTPRESYWRAMDSAGIRPNPTRTVEGKTFSPPTGRHFTFVQERVDEMYNEGRIQINKNNKLEYLCEETNTMALNSNWTDISGYSFTTGYPTENSEALLKRVINASSDENDLVLDCFGGSGTTAAVAEMLNRRWITADIGRFSIHTMRKRLLSIPNVKPFMVQNLGKYERQLWQTAEFGDKAESTQLNYRRFILALYNAQTVEGYTWLHGLKAGRMVYVGAVDSPVSPSDVGQIAAEFKRATGTGRDAPTRNGVDVLGWDFAFELNEVAKQQAAQANINMRFIRIPREVLEKKAVEQGDIRFFELAALSIDKTQKGHAVTLTLTDFVIPQDDVPDDIREAVTHWEQWIDYWAVDWNNREDTFHNEWQDYRTGKKRELLKSIGHTYEKPGSYLIMVKVIDILGNDTTKTLKVEVN
jgi:16S rRNA G966 N2-methylase RsmD